MTPLTLTAAQRTVLNETRDFWLATVRPTPGGHLVPIWAVLVNDVLYIGTERKAQKVKNILAHPRAAFALPDTRQVLIFEGTVTLLDNPVPSAVLQAFQDKYNWNIAAESETSVISLTPDKVISWDS